MTTEALRNARWHVFFFSLFVLLAAIFWWPTFFGKSQISGDSIVHGYPFLDYLRKVIYGKYSLLWTENMYGGHPIFAESQGGFANPFNILVAALFPSVVGHNIFHFLCVVISAAGTYLLVRREGCSEVAAGVGAISLAFSGAWLSAQQNLSISAALAWSPWMLWGYVSVKTSPNLKSVALLAFFSFMEATSGYAQILHAICIYIFCDLLAFFVVNRRFHSDQVSTKKVLISLSVGAVLGVMLSAVQLLPLLELTFQSHRSGGVGIWGVEIAYVLRGMFWTPESYNGGPVYVPYIGSSVVCLLIPLVFATRAYKKVFGHILAVALLFLLGIGDSSPVFDFIYNFHLIPGLHFFRTVTAYLFVGQVGIAIIVAKAIDEFSGTGALSRYFVKYKAALWLLITIACLVLFYLYRIPHTNFAQYILAIVLAGIIWVSFQLKSRSFFPFAVLALLLMDVSITKLALFNYFDNKNLEKPVSLKSLEQRENVRDYKFWDTTIYMTYGMWPPKSKNLLIGERRTLDAVSASSNLLWNVASINGATALSLARRELIDDLIVKELAEPGKKGQLRLIDVLGIRYITSTGNLEKYGLLAAYSSKYNFRIYENVQAKPRVQVYREAVFVKDAAQAVNYIAENGASKLVVEGEAKDKDRGWLQPGKTSETNGNGRTPVKTLVKSSTYYKFLTNDKNAFWLFVADSNYPGWKAFIDGKASKVYSAQILGKAVLIPRGKHEVVLRFESKSFLVGLVLSAIAALLIILLLGLNFLRPESSQKILNRRGGRSAWQTPNEK